MTLSHTLANYSPTKHYYPLNPSLSLLFRGSLKRHEPRRLENGQMWERGTQIFSWIVLGKDVESLLRTLEVYL